VVDLSASQVFFPARRTLFRALLDPDVFERLRFTALDFLADDFDRLARFLPVPLADFLVAIVVSGCGVTRDVGSVTDSIRPYIGPYHLWYAGLLGQLRFSGVIHVG
jgi:hypothetical protein